MRKNFELMFECDGGVAMSLLFGERLVYVNYYDDMEIAAADLREFFSIEYSIQHWEDNMLDDEDFDPADYAFNAAVERSGLAYWATDIDEIRKSVQFATWKNLQVFLNAWGI